ncbi:hypothetical protein FG379_001121 [Cryptosporidium bovis]|uniref:uncharacterized protein n=1 Tax=Cryptosporidium bovis TaxID=310047 RepID=UPI00351A4841|nr:hypothetical protein FG379_001121 [Cryptosporidium bovis]
MATVSEAVRNSWMHIFSFDSAIPRSKQKETISEVLKDINRIKDEMQTLHLRFSDIEHGKLDLLSIENVESQFEKMKQQLQLHTLLISELRKYHSEIDDLKHKEEYRLQEERELRNELRKLKNEFQILSETVNNRNILHSTNLPGIISKLDSLQIDFETLSSRVTKNEKLKSEMENIKRDVNGLSTIKKNIDDQNYIIKQMKEDISLIQSVVHEDIPQLKSEIQRKMNKTIQATNELKETVSELKDQFRTINDERRQDHNVISQLATQAEQLRIQIQAVKINQKDQSSNKLRQEELVNQCVKNIAKLAESVNNLQEKISNHLIGLSVSKSNNGFSVTGSKNNSHIKTPILVNKTTPKGNYYEVASNNENYKRLANKGKNSPRNQKSITNYFSLPDTPSTQAPMMSTNSERLGSFFGGRELCGIISTSSHSSSNFTENCHIDSLNNSRQTTNNTCDQDNQNIILSTNIDDERIVSRTISEEDEVSNSDNSKKLNSTFLEIKSSVNSSEETNCTTSDGNYLVSNKKDTSNMLLSLSEVNDGKLSSINSSPRKTEDKLVSSSNAIVTNNNSNFIRHQEFLTGY